MFNAWRLSDGKLLERVKLTIFKGINYLKESMMLGKNNSKNLTNFG